jgi:hypothetical protein
MGIDNAVTDLELDVWKRLDLEVFQVLFNWLWLCDDFLLFPAGRAAGPRAAYQLRL